MVLRVCKQLFSNLHCIILIEIDILRYIITGYYCILEEQFFPEIVRCHTHTHTHMNCGGKNVNFESSEVLYTSKDCILDADFKYINIFSVSQKVRYVSHTLYKNSNFPATVVGVCDTELKFRE